MRALCSVVRGGQKSDTGLTGYTGDKDEVRVLIDRADSDSDPWYSVTRSSDRMRIPRAFQL